MDPTGQGLTKLLKRKRLDNLLNELESDPESFEGGKKMTKAQWKQVSFKFWSLKFSLD